MKIVELISLIMVYLMLVENSHAADLRSSQSTTWKNLRVVIVSDKNSSDYMRAQLETENVRLKKTLLKIRTSLLRNSTRLSKDGKTLELLSSSFHKASQTYGIPADVLQALAFVESSYRVNAINFKSNDFGIMQINEFNIKAYGFSKQKLLTDVDYSINAGAKVFKWFYDRYPLDEAIKRYNCGTRRKCVRYKSVKKYLYKVKRAM